MTRRKMLNVVIPMAGRGSRFANAGYTMPKPLIDVAGYPMIRIVYENLRPSINHRFIFIILKDHIKYYNIESTIRSFCPQAEIFVIPSVTNGAAETALAASELINNSNPILLANSDQYINHSIDRFLKYCDLPQMDGCIMTMKSNDPKWSYVQIKNNDMIERVAEKEVISNHATTGLYYFKKGSDFVRSATKMISRNERQKGEFYVAPCYNSLIDTGFNCGYYSIGGDRDGMHGLGTPEDLQDFLNSAVLNSFIKTKIAK